MRVQRLRVSFSKGPQLRYITHLDLMRFWERALRRAEIALAYSEGFSPHPQISLAAPLPVGVTSRAELMDVFLSERSSPLAFTRSLSPQLPPGLELNEVEEVPVSLPSIQSQMRAAEYRVELLGGETNGGLAGRVAQLLDLETLPWRHTREREVKSYDLRPLIQELSLQTEPGQGVLLMRLQADNAATGRPDQVLAALQLLPELAVERTRLVLSEPGCFPADSGSSGVAADSGQICSQVLE